MSESIEINTVETEETKKEPSFTPSQQRARDYRGRDLLVSAGAGSGKTTVLAARILERIKAGDDINDFLIVTFTKASAADLKKKLSEKLEELSAKEPDNKHYRRQIYALSGADIGTIDSFCLRYVKQNAQSLGYKSMAVGDGALCAALAADSADRVITELCEEDGAEIDLLLDNFASHKSDDGLVKACIGLYSDIRTFPFYMQWLEDAVARLVRDARRLHDEDFFALERGKEVRAVCEAELAVMEDDLETMLATADDKGLVFCGKVKAALALMRQGLEEDYYSFSAATSAYAPGSRRGGDDEYIAAYNDLKGRVSRLSDLCRTRDALIREYDVTAEVAAALLVFMKRLDECYTAEKKRRGIIDFSDAEQLFLSLLVEEKDGSYLKKPLGRKLSAAYKEVYIDEYQDVSPLQDSIFRVIGEGRRFMVGDVKQSIYGFRDAHPELFMGYRDSYGEEGKGEGELVLLRENFRCDKTVIDFCNHVCDRIYTVERADGDYTKERLIHGKDDSGGVPVSVWLYENAKDYRTEQAEVCNEVVRLIASGVKPSEIGLLFHDSKHMQSYSDELEARGIATGLKNSKEKLLDRPEILLMISALRTVDNPTDDISLAALLRSPVFRFTAGELVEIRDCSISLYEDLCAKAEEDSVLGEKCAAFLERLSLYRAKALILPVHKLLWYLYEDFRIFAYAPKGDEEKFRANLNAFYSLAMGMEQDAFRGVSVFTDYLRRLEEKGQGPDAERSKSAEGVRLLTVHGSKGLEFDAVFLCDTGKRGKSSDGNAVRVNFDTGLSLSLKKQREAWSAKPLLKHLDGETEKHKEYAEEHRLLYVALTRARKKLYVSATFSDGVWERIDKKKQSTFADLFLAAVAKGGEMFYNIEVKDCAEAEQVQPLALSGIEREASAEETALPPLREAPPPPRTVTAKYSASALVRDENGKLVAPAPARVSDRLPCFAGGGPSAGARRGTANHVFMQFADFKRAEADLVAEADRLLDRGFVTEEQRRLMDTEALGRFFRSDIYARIKASPRVYRERRFSTALPGYLFKDAGEEQVMLQGVIDCFFENPDGSFTLIDYKTDRVGEGGAEALRDSYGVQLYLYRLYVEKITGRPVTGAYIYSFALSDTVDVGDIDPFNT
ncbi:MAG: UvrD-helicase domain-containing protein [Clostridia bacterium]|nr:UvrD-helicase domain-containing protein [Clostridia bacterium]